jgi:ABC-type nitrate/sulfonate/bicarbonate transport system substrate-binding protein
MKFKLFICALGLALVAPSVAGAEPVTLRLGFIKASLHLFQSAYLYVAQQKGMLDREGIKLDIVPLPGVSRMITALDDGTVDISSTAVPYLVEGALKGSDAVAVVGAPANTINSFVSRPDFTSFDQLKGKTIGLSLPVDIISIGARELLARHGLGKSDYAVRELVGTPERTNCLKTGDCAATVLTQPDDVTVAHEGFHILGNSHEVIPTLQFTVFAARRTWASQHKDAVTRFARAMGETFKFMADPANRDEVISIAAKATGASKDITTEIYKLYYEPYSGVLPKNGEISMPGMSEVIRLLADSKEISSPAPPADRFVDLQYLKSAGMQ